MLLVKGGETKGSTTTAPKNHLNPLGRVVLVTEKAKRKPRKVPKPATAVARRRLLSNAFRLYQLEKALARFPIEPVPST
jgi:hypothetical protein